MSSYYNVYKAVKPLAKIAGTKTVKGVKAAAKKHVYYSTLFRDNNITDYSSPVQVGSGSWGTTSISGNVYASAFTGQL